MTTNGRSGVREPAPITDMQITQSDGLIGGTGVASTFSLQRPTNEYANWVAPQPSWRTTSGRIVYRHGRFATMRHKESDQKQKKDRAPAGAAPSSIMQLVPAQFH